MNEAIAWALFAGSWLLVAGETWEIVEHHHWPQWVFWALLVFMTGSALLNTALRMTGSQRALRDASAATAGSG